MGYQKMLSHSDVQSSVISKLKTIIYRPRLWEDIKFSFFTSDFRKFTLFVERQTFDFWNTYVHIYVSFLRRRFRIVWSNYTYKRSYNMNLWMHVHTRMYVCMMWWVHGAAQLKKHSHITYILTYIKAHSQWEVTGGSAGANNNNNNKNNKKTM